METCDDDFVDKATDFIKRAKDADKPFFVWLNTTHMHMFTHTKKESLGQAGRWQSPYHDTMVDHDKNVGQMLDLLDELGLAEDTFVMYSTDNGPHMNSWPDGGMTPFRSEKNTNWEGAFRVPLLARWPGKIEAGRKANGIVQHHDWLSTFLAMAGNETVIDDLKKGTTVNGKPFKNHIDGYNLLPYLTGEVEESPRNFFFYFSDDGDVLAMRYDNWKLVFMEQRVQGTMQVWAEPFVSLRVPKLFNLRTDPYERADVTSNTYWNWYIERMLPDFRSSGWSSASGRPPSRTSHRSRSRTPSPSTTQWQRCGRRPRGQTDRVHCSPRSSDRAPLDKGFEKNFSTTTLQKGLMGGISLQGSKITKITPDK